MLGILESEKEMVDIKKLYEILSDGVTKYGYKLAVNSKSEWVMETKGTGEVVAVDPSIVTEVLPYTIDVSYTGEALHNYSYLADQGKYEVGDVLVIHGPATGSWCLVRVEKINTKSRAATKEIKPIAVMKGTV